VKRGKELFTDIQCSSCHHPSFETGQHEFSFLSNQLIFLPVCCCTIWKGWSPTWVHGRCVVAPSPWGHRAYTHSWGHSRFLHDGRAGKGAILWPAGRPGILAGIKSLSGNWSRSPISWKLSCG
jgi:CxxC motif-containing protein (DUF1111 family)